MKQILLNNILFVFACKEESNGLFESFGENVIFTGVGKVNATYSLTKKLTELRLKNILPEYVINIGTAGSSKYRTEEIVYCNKFIQYDMNAVKFGYQLGVTPSDTYPLIIEHQEIIKDLPNAICGSADCFEPCKEIANKIDVVDMEAYALAKVCKLENINFISLKYVSNGFDDDSINNWHEEAKKCGKKIFEYLKTVERNEN